ncbi:11S globulin seed storage protein 1-like [Cornus florida]|uniref:11S globulin seed storage protein 1-like n=1 Tax=Cornus florida TaxID=4283 RepID=UPI002898DC12|nr:11S globulin seed storage protein 1-like [Cornus florida]
MNRSRPTRDHSTIPGCPETYQSFQQSQEGRTSQRSRDQHQKVLRFRQGDIIALPAGIAHWSYNDGNNQLVLVVVHDTNNDANQLDQRLRKFFLAGNQQEQQPRSLYGQQQRFGNNIFQAFNVEILAEAFNVDTETARKLHNENDRRGNIVRVERGLQLTRPKFEEEERREERERGRYNGLEETICSMRLRENIANPELADVYSACGGCISTVNSHNLPILRCLQLSAERGVLYRNALIVGNSQRPVFNGQVRAGQLLIVPQNFAVVKKAGDQGFEWISFKTNDFAKTSPLARRTSAIQALPEDVLVHDYQVSRDEAKRLKYNREEVTILSPRLATVISACSGTAGGSPSPTLKAWAKLMPTFSSWKAKSLPFSTFTNIELALFGLEVSSSGLPALEKVKSVLHKYLQHPPMPFLFF